MSIYIKTSKYDLKQDVSDLFFIAFFTSAEALVLLSKVFGVLHISGFAAPCLLFGIAFLFVLCLAKYPYRRWIKCLSLYLGVILLFLVSYFITPELAEWYLNPNWGLIYRVFRLDRGIYAFLAIVIVGEPKKILRDLKIVAFIWLPYLLFQTIQRIQFGYFITVENDGITTTTSLYTLSYGYNAIFAGLIFLTCYKKNQNVIYLVFGWLTCGLAVAFGSRGALLVLCCYFFIWELLKLKQDISKKGFVSKKGVICTLLLLCLAVVAVASYDYIIISVDAVFDRLGIQSRTLQSLLSSSISDTNGRGMLWEATIEQIRKKFPLGAGAFGDRLSAGKVLAWGYCHNIVLEMLASFGIVGVVVLIVMAYKSVKIIVSDIDYELVSLFVLFLSCSMKLLISDSFWYNAHFWGTLAIAYLHKKKKELISKENR